MNTKYVSSYSLLIAIIIADYILYIKDVNKYIIPTTLRLPLYTPLKTYIPFIKPFIVSVLWSVATVILPNNMNNIDNEFTDLISTCAMFFNIFAITNEEDIYDIDDDLQNNINTFPILIGEKKTLNICKACVLSSVVLGAYSDHSTLFNILNVNQAVKLKKAEQRIKKKHIHVKNTNNVRILAKPNHIV